MDIDLLKLLGRPPLRIPHTDAFYTKCLVITGAGGSIGSALIRRLCLRVPFLGLIDIVEAPLFKLQQELGQRVNIEYKVCDAGRDPEEWITQWQPTHIIHAGAHKHVHLMEKEPDEAFRNNTINTMRIAQAAKKMGVSLTFISTDKAAQTTSIMGASKRIAEAWLLTHMPTASICRFGNVAGSSGSLIEIAQARILAGQDVILTDPQMRRWFITPNEAVDLVLFASISPGLFALGMGEQILVKEIIERVAKQLGKPVKIILGKPGPGEKIEENIINPHELIATMYNSDLLKIYTNLNRCNVDSAIEGVLSRRFTLVEAANSLVDL